MKQKREFRFLELTKSEFAAKERMDKKMEILRILLKIIMWVLIAGFACNFVMQTVSYSFYKRADRMTDITSVPQYIQMTDKLTGYGYNLEAR